MFENLLPCKRYKCFGIPPITPSPSPTEPSPSPPPWPEPSPSPPSEPEEPGQNSLLLQVGLGLNFTNLFSICSKKARLYELFINSLPFYATNLKIVGKFFTRTFTDNPNPCGHRF